MHVLLTACLVQSRLQYSVHMQMKAAPNFGSMLLWRTRFARILLLLRGQGARLAIVMTWSAEINLTLSAQQ